MTAMTKTSRFHKMLSGEKVDRSIVSGWCHFLDKEQNASDLAEATIEFVKKYEWDWIKINPRATYIPEAFGNKYDLSDYRGVFPKQVHTVVQEPKEVWKIQPVNVKTSAAFQEQLEAAKQMREGLSDTPMIQTIFSPLTILLFLIGQAAYVNDTIYGVDEPAVTFEKLYKEERAGVHHALHAIAVTLADYVKELEEIGIDGLFYAVTGTAHPELFDEVTFNEVSRPYDLIVLNAVDKGKRVLHTCGAYSQPERFNDYPIEGISWDTKAEGNPDLDAELRPVKVGGIDHHVFHEEDTKEIQKQAQGSINLMNHEPFVLAPNCAVPPGADEKTYLALKNTISKGEN